MATTYFRNPANGYVVKATGELPLLWTFLLGPFYLGYKGLWGHAFLLLLTTVGTAGLAWLVYPFFAGSLIRKRYLEAGWQPVDRMGSERALPGVRGPSVPGQAVGRVVGLAAAGVAIAVLVPALLMSAHAIWRYGVAPKLQPQAASWSPVVTPAVQRIDVRGPK